MNYINFDLFEDFLDRNLLLVFFMLFFEEIVFVKIEGKNFKVNLI